jgi:hypothetical protein
MKKQFLILFGVFSFELSLGQEKAVSGFEIGPNFFAFTPPFLNDAGKFYNSSVTFFNGAQLTYNFEKFSVRSQYRFSSDYMVNEFTAQTHPGGTSYHFYKMKQLKIGGQYYFKKKIRKLYSYLDFTGGIHRSQGNGRPGWAGNLGDYTYKGKMNTIGFDVGFGYKVKMYGNFSVATEMGLNSDFGHYYTETLYYNDHMRIEKDKSKSLNSLLEGRILLAVKIK